MHRDICHPSGYPARILFRPALQVVLWIRIQLGSLFTKIHNILKIEKKTPLFHSVNSELFSRAIIFLRIFKKDLFLKNKLSFSLKSVFLKIDNVTMW